MRKTLLTICLCLMSLIASAGDIFTFGTKTNPKGVTFEVDGQSFIIGGKRVLPVMGEIHYARVPERDWRREICKMRAGGITVIATYVFWIHHEEKENVWNWSGNRNLRKFIQICGEEGMPVVLRIGPFCHGEVYQGGFPDWVVKRSFEDPKNYKLRSTGKGFLDEAEQLYNNIGAQVRGLLWKDGGPIVGVQIENECRGPWNYLMTLKKFAVNAGFDVPFYTRTGWPKMNGKAEFGQILPLYGDYADGFWDRSMKDMPGEYPDAFKFKNSRISSVIATETFSKNELKEDSSPSAGEGGGRGSSYPYLTCELGGGMMQAYHRRINMSGKEMFPLAVCKVGSGSNLPGYYMYHGGTNPSATVPATVPDASPSVPATVPATVPSATVPATVPDASPSVPRTMGETQNSPVTNYNDMPYMSYDFQCPLGEVGQVFDTPFHQGRWFHQFLADWGEELAAAKVDSLSDHYAHRGTFVFRNDYVRILNENGSASVMPDKMPYNGLTITSSSVQPFAKADGQLYFITAPNCRKYSLDINGKKYTLKPDKLLTVQGQVMTLLSPDKAKTAYVIDGKMHYAQRGGILYKMEGKVVEETWKEMPDAQVTMTQTQPAGIPRVIPIGQQKVAAMPTNEDFDKAAVWTINVPQNPLEEGMSPDDLFLEITYKGDVARIYADGKLIEDNFWNGKPFYVRVADLLGACAGSHHAKIELKILPLPDNAKDLIYFQQEQKSQLEPGKTYIQSIKLIGSTRFSVGSA